MQRNVITMVEVLFQWSVVRSTVRRREVELNDQMSLDSYVLLLHTWYSETIYSCGEEDALMLSADRLPGLTGRK